jgi:hypothetical protein
VVIIRKQCSNSINDKRDNECSNFIMQSQIYDLNE